MANRLFRQSLKFSNNSESAMQLRIEPWGDVVLLDPRAAVDIMVTSDRDGALEFVYGPEPAILAWSGATVDVMQDGRVILSYPIPSP